MGGGKNGNWQKIKREEEDGRVVDLDAVEETTRWKTITRKTDPSLRGR